MEILQEFFLTKIYIENALKCREGFETLSRKRRNRVEKRMKKGCRTRWLILHAGDDATYEEYEGLVTSLQQIQATNRKSGSLTGGFY